MTELIIAEKPKAAQKIAEALGKAKKESIDKIPFYRLKYDSKDVIVGSAVGHLFSLAQKTGLKSAFPVFDIEWKPTSEVQKKSDFSKKYVAALKKLVKEANEFTVATDYDIEGEVIGLNVVRFIAKRKDANRMKFSTLTKDDLIEAYKNKSKHLDWGQAEAGETRHILDWYYGINISRALTSAAKEAGYFALLSSGRVQGPALKLVVDREREIKAFIPIPYWEIRLYSGIIEALHEKERFDKKEEAEKIFNKVKSQKKALIQELAKKESRLMPPHPFDLTSLQIEAYRALKISPKRTLELAQNLYIEGVISYPRTSSQVLPPEINYKKILNALAAQENLKEKVNLVLKKQKLQPNNGAKIDPAHPAIYPTGLISENLDKDELRLYDLIVKRFLATFGEAAVRETLNIKINCNNEIFLAKGTRTKEKNWLELYDPYVALEEIEYPGLKQGQTIDVDKINLLDKETQPPKRYTEASIIKELEKRNLGTKSTRAQVIDTLYKRNYVEDRQIRATELGIKTIETLEKYCPLLLDEELTRHFEEEMDSIRERKTKEDKVLDEAKQAITKIIDQFKKHKSEIGEKLTSAHAQVRDEQSTIGLCPNCKKGTLKIRRGKFGMFIACDLYPECKTTFSLPNALVKPTAEICEHCKYPVVTLIKKGKRPQNICINQDCPSKKVVITEKKKCPKCNQGEMVVKKSIYGPFLACNRYPECKNTEKINNNQS